MIPFSEVTIADRAWLEPILLSAGTKSADYSFVNIYAWAEYYALQAARLDGRAVTRFYTGSRWVYSFPVGEGPLKPAMEAILADAAERGESPVIAGVTDEMERELSPLYPNAYEILPYPEGFDYIYDVAKLAQLPGKKLHGKRGHLRKFEEAHPQWTFLPMTAEDVSDCRALARQWLSSLEGDKTQAEAEAKMLEICFRELEELGMLGGVLRIAGEIAGFTMASAVSHDTLDVHVEKARWEIDGAYPMVNREFARLVQKTCPEIRWLNREDDMGLENLRKAKKSYYPEELLAKSALRWKA